MNEQLRETAVDCLNNIDSFVANTEQLKAIKERDFIKARKLGVNLDYYLYEINNKYRHKLYNLAYT